MAALLLIVVNACKKDEIDKASPTADKVEIGTDNDKRGFIGMDFHFNAAVIAGDKIESVQIQILQKTGETYVSSWKFEVLWPEFKGVKNATVHKHFTIPQNAPKGKYDFIFTVTDQNGTRLEMKSDFSIMDVNDLPVNPVITVRGGITDNQVFKKDDHLTLNVQVAGYKDDGVIYALLIKNKHNHNPETVAAIDFSKAVVLEQVSHTAAPANSAYRLTQSLLIGSAKDNKLPAPGNIDGLKAWESGTYSVLIVYRNTTHSINVTKKIPITINY